MSGEPTPAADESWLVLHAQGGSREHLERLMIAAQEFLSRRLAPLFDEPADAEDLLQDVLFTICRRLWTLNDARLFRPWAHRIAMRAAWKSINRKRREGKQREESIDVDSLPGVAAELPGIDVGALLHTISP